MNSLDHFILGQLILGDGPVSLLPDIAYPTFGFEKKRVPEYDKRVRVHRWLHSPLMPLVLMFVNKRLAKVWALHLLLDSLSHDNWQPFYPLPFTIKRRILHA
jgi:hypothetical protein